MVLQSRHTAVFFTAGTEKAKTKHSDDFTDLFFDEGVVKEISIH